jgi:hypothetical protein
MPSDVLITPASSKIEFTDGANATKTLKITGTSLNTDTSFAIGATTANNTLSVLGSTSIGSGYNVAGPTNGLIVQGNVGIGTTNPSQVLDVRGNIKLGADNSGNYIYYVKDTEGTIINTSRSDSTQQGLFRSDGWGNFTADKSIGIGYSLGSSFGAGTIGNGNLYVLNTVGIGTTSPLTKLEIRSGSITAGTATSTNGSTIIAGYYTAGSLTTLGTEYASGGPVLGYAVTPSTSSTGAFLSATSIAIPRSAYTQDGGTHRWYIGASQTVAIGSAVTASEVMRININGNVGIGTTNPATLLHVDTAGADARIRVSAGTNTVQGGMIANTNGLVYAGSITNHGFSLRTNDTDRVRIQTDGNVGIGSTSPAYKLEVVGDTRVSGGIINAGLSAQWVLSGGGTVTYNGSAILWSVRVIAIPIEKDELSTTGYIDIGCPTSGTITYYNSGNGISTVTCAASGIPIGIWEALYYEITPGQTQTSDQTKFRLVNYQNSTWRPSSNWLLICALNGDSSSLKWIPGQVIIPTNGSFDSSNSTNNWQIAGTTNYVPKFTSANKIGNSVLYDNSANIGVGTASPAYKLDVAGRISYNGAIGEGADATLSSSGTVLLHGNSATWTEQRFYTSGTQKATINTGGNLGIGTTSPSDALYVYRTSGDSSATFKTLSGGSELNLDATNGYAAIKIYSSGVEKWRVGQINDSTGFQIYQSGTGARIYVNSSGNVGIGTTTVSYKLHVQGDIYARSAVINISTDLNSLRGNVTTMGYSLTNSPSGAGWITVYTSQNFLSGGDILSQLAYDNYNQQKLFTRYSADYGATWSAWKTIINSDALSGTTNYVPKFTGTNSIGNSLIFDNGTNVAIGSNAVAYGRLQISATGTSPSLSSTNPTDASLIISNSDIAYGTMFATYGDGKGALQQRRTNAATYYDFSLQPHGGNIGIGTLSPTQKLDVSGTVRSNIDNSFGFVLNRSATNTWSGIGYTTASASKWFVGLREVGDDNLRWYNYTNSAERMVLTEAGNLGLGTTTPSLSSGKGLHIFSNSGHTNLKLDNAGRIWELLATTGGYFSIFDTTGGADRIAIASSGNVGIGVTGPNNKLHVNGSASIGSGYNTAAPTDGLIVQGNVGIGSTSASAKLSLNKGATNQFLALDIANNTAKYAFYLDQDNNGSNSFSLWDTTNSHTAIRYLPSSSGYWQIYTNNVERLRINSLGNVGIGTTIPLAQLHINETVSGTAALRVDGTNGTLFSVIDDLSDSLMSVNNSAGLPVLEVFADDRIIAGQYGANDLVVRNNKVGVGTGNPSNELHVYASASGSTIASNAIAVFEQSSNAGIQVCVPDASEAGLFFSRSGAAYYSAITRNGTDLLLKNNSATAVTINSSGNVGINTANPTTKLYVTGSVTALDGTFVSNVTSGADKYFLNCYGTSTNQMFSLYENSSNVYLNSYTTMALRANQNGGSGGYITLTGGNVGVGGNPSARLHVIDTNQSPATGNLLVSSTGGNASIRIDSNASTNYTYLTLSQAGTGKFELGIVPTTSDLYINPNVQTGSTNAAIYIKKADGNVGIGNTSPSYKLDVNGTLNASGTATLAAVSITGTITTSATEAMRVNNNNGYISIYNSAGSTRTGYIQGLTGSSLTLSAENSAILQFNVSGSERARIATDGNVGIGTTNTGYSLNLYAASAPQFTLSNATRSFILTNNAGDGLLSFNYATVNRLQFNTTNQWFNTGNLGIGTTNPLSTLHLYGAAPTILTLGSTSYPSTYLTTLGVDSSARGFLIFGNNGENQVRAGRTAAGGYLDFYTNNTVDQTTLASDGNFVMRLTANGNVGIGTTAPAAKLQVIAGNSPAVSAYSNNSGQYAYMQIGRTSSELEIGVIGSTNQFFTGTVAGDAVIKQNSTGKLHLGYGSGAPAITINSSNNVGVGTTIPATLLQINTGTPTVNTGGIQFGDDTSARLYRSASGIVTCSGTIAATFSGNLTGNVTGNVSGSSGSCTGNTTGSSSFVTGLGTLNYDIDRTVKRSGLSHYSGYSTGTNRPTTYDYTLQVTDGTKGWEISMDWIATTGPAIYARSLRDCCQNWSTWVRILDSANYPNAANLNQGVGTSNSPSFTGLTVTNTIIGSISGNAGTVTNGLYTNSTLTAGNLSGTIPSGVLGNSTHYIGTTAIALNRGSGSQSLTGVSIDGNAANVTGTVAIANGGTGTTTAQLAINALAGAVTSAQYLRGNGTNVVMSAIQAADVPTLNQNTTGSSASCTGTSANVTYAPNRTDATSYPVLWGSGTTNTQLYSCAAVTIQSSTGTLFASTFSGSGASLTSLPAGNLAGTIPSAVLGNSTLYVGTTAMTLNRASATQSLTGVSIDGSSGSVAALGVKTGALDANIVTFAKMQQVTGPVAIGRVTATLGDMTTLSGADLATIIGANTITNATNATTATTANALNTGNSYTVNGLTSNSTVNIFPAYSSPYSYFLRMGYDNSGSYDYTIKRNGTTGFLEFNGTQAAPYVGYVFSSGNLGVGTSPSSYKLDVNGACHATSFPTSSDGRFKKKIKPIENCVEKVKKMQGVSYEWNEFINDRRDGYSLNTPVFGVIAQDLEKVIPEVVSKWHLSDDCKDARAVDYIRIIPVLIEAIKEQQVELDDLKKRLLALENK